MDGEDNTSEVTHKIPTEPIEKARVLHTVTPVSKYLAMLLFIATPFIGGWIGYQYGVDTKAVEVERVITQDSVVMQEEVADSKTYRNQETGFDPIFTEPQAGEFSIFYEVEDGVVTGEWQIATSEDYFGRTTMYFLPDNPAGLLSPKFIMSNKDDPASPISLFGIEPFGPLERDCLSQGGTATIVIDGYYVSTDGTGLDTAIVTEVVEYSPTTSVQCL